MIIARKEGGSIFFFGNCDAGEGGGGSPVLFSTKRNIAMGVLVSRGFILFFARIVDLQGTAK